MTAPALSISNLTISAGDVELLHIESLEIAPGERVGLIGESGSGKTLTALAVMGLLADGVAAAGVIHIPGTTHNVLGASERTLSSVRGRTVSMVFQEPMTALNPLMTVGAQVAEVMLQHGTHRKGSAAGAAAQELLTRVGLPTPATTARVLPHQLSGGQRQRVVLAMALANKPALLLCDEPTTALDVTVQSQMLTLIDDLVTDSGSALLFVTHDLAVAATLCDRIVVLRRGVVVEQGPTAQVLGNPSHEYTRALVAASDVGAAPARSGASAVAPAQAPGADSTPLLEARGLSRIYPGTRPRLFEGPTAGRGLHPVSFDIRAGQTVGIVGESGSGKSTLVRLLAGLDSASSGSITFDGTDLATATPREMRGIREKVAMVFQDPASSLDPRMTVAQIVAEPLHGLSRDDTAHRVEEMLLSVGLPSAALTRFPHQFSGGERQRISIARALVTKPRLLIADEPVSALDVSVRARVLALLDDLVDEYNLTLVLVSHDLAVVRRVCDTVMVMFEGVVVESGRTDDVYTNPQHDYTRTLVAATPTLRGALARN